MCGDYSQKVQKECRALCRQRGLPNGGSVSEMRVLLFDFDLGEHDDGGIKILLAEQTAASPGRLKIIAAKLGAIKERDHRSLQLVAQWASLDETALCSKLLSDHGVTPSLSLSLSNSLAPSISGCPVSFALSCDLSLCTSRALPLSVAGSAQVEPRQGEWCMQSPLDLL